MRMPLRWMTIAFGMNRAAAPARTARSPQSRSSPAASGKDSSKVRRFSSSRRAARLAVTTKPGEAVPGAPACRWR